MIIQGVCSKCGEHFEYEYMGGSRRKYCSLKCQRSATINNRNHKHPEKYSDYNHKSKLQPELLDRYNYKCAICGWNVCNEIEAETIKTSYKAKGLEIHHIVPVKDGGKAEYDNLIVLCPNHHKMANMGIIKSDELIACKLPPLTQEEKNKKYHEAVMSAPSRIANAIFMVGEENVEN